MKRIVKVACVSMAALLASAASATVAAGSSYTLNFSGLCSDCSGTDTAQLMLKNYILGSDVTSANFVSLRFYGSDLYQGGFTITAPTSMSGKFSTTSSSAADFFVTDNSNFFSSQLSGAWRLGRGSGRQDLDQGTNGLYVGGNASSAPEPASWAMMLAGFGMIGAAARRRRVSTRISSG